MVLQKPSQSPDLNRTEMLRRDLKRPANELKQQKSGTKFLHNDVRDR